MNDHEELFMQIMDLVANYCETSKDFDCIISNVECMKESFEEEEEREEGDDNE